jgi:hypothetical protein
VPEGFSWREAAAFPHVRNGQFLYGQEVVRFLEEGHTVHDGRLDRLATRLGLTAGVIS